MLETTVMLGSFTLLYYRGDHNGACESHAPEWCDWCGSRKLFVKNNNIRVVYMHTRTAMNGCLRRLF